MNNSEIIESLQASRFNADIINKRVGENLKLDNYSVKNIKKLSNEDIKKISMLIIN